LEPKPSCKPFGSLERLQQQHRHQRSRIRNRMQLQELRIHSRSKQLEHIRNHWKRQALHIRIRYLLH
jgi:hypothetical protein